MTTNRCFRCQALRLWTLLALTLAASPLRAQASHAVSEYELKAAFLYNFAKFVDWPDSVLGPPDRPIVFGVVGDDPFGPILDRTLQGKTVHQRSVRILRFTKIEDLQFCHILFVGVSRNNGLEKLLGAVAGLPVLTVGDSKEFAHLGGVIHFTLEQNKVRFEINLKTAEAAGLKISSQLLQLARAVRRD